MSSVGLIGSAIMVSAYWPQIIKLFKIKKSDGLSLIAWVIWLVGNAMLLSYAISTRDLVYIILESVSVFSLVLICVLIIKYQNKR